MSERGQTQPEVYTSLAGWFHLVTSPADSDYVDEAAFVLSTLREHCDGSITELLELGSGGGNLASYLKGHASVTLTDLSPDMLVLSRTLLRYLEWTWDPDPSDSTFVTDYAYLLREGDAPPRAIPDRHVLGLFSREAWSGLLEGVGFVPYRVIDPWERDVFVGVRSPSRVAS